MSSAIHKLQESIDDPSMSLTRLLRQAKIIAASLGLAEVEQWVDLELKGYPQDRRVPMYRQFVSSHVEIRNPGVFNECGVTL